MALDVIDVVELRQKCISTDRPFPGTRGSPLEIGDEPALRMQFREVRFHAEVL
jgi:hypothetical protein